MTETEILLQSLPSPWSPGSLDHLSFAYTPWMLCVLSGYPIWSSLNRSITEAITREKIL
jgi:hypothetical protein